MDDLTLVLLWDEVIEDIIEHILKAIFDSRKTLVEDVFLRPMVDVLEKTVAELMKLFTQFPEVSYLRQVMEFVFQFMYIAALFMLVLSTVWMMLKWGYHYWLGKEKQINLLMPLQKVFALQILHILILPFILKILDKYPNFLQWLNELFMIKLEKVTSQFFILKVSEELLVLHILALILIVIALVRIYFQYLMQGFKLISFLISSYLQVIFSTDFSAMLEPLKMTGTEMFIVFIIQRLLLMYLFAMEVKSETIADLYYYAVCLVFVSFFPKIILKGITKNETE